jgi:hypothetical protein
MRRLECYVHRLIFDSRRLSTRKAVAFIVKRHFKFEVFQSHPETVIVKSSCLVPSQAIVSVSSRLVRLERKLAYSGNIQTLPSISDRVDLGPREKASPSFGPEC